MQTRRERFKRRVLRYRKTVHGYTLYIVMVALFLSLLPIVLFSMFGIEAHIYVLVIAIIIFTLMALIYLAFTKRDIIDKFGWFMLIIILPFFGAFLFWFVGISQLQPKIYRKKSKKDIKYLAQSQKEYLTELSEDLAKAEVIAPYSQFTTGNTHKFLSGQDVYDHMLEDIQSAKNHIHLEMYIVRHDKKTKPIFDALIEKAQNGVEVRFLIDVFGSLFLKDKFIESLMDSGIEVVFFNQQTRAFLDHFHVNHRKNLVIDGKIAYTGGFNLGAEYVDGYPKKKLKWYDLMVRIEGNLVHSIQRMFLLDWCFSMEEPEAEYLSNKKFFPQEKLTEPINGVVTQFISDGPDREGTPVKDILRHLILNAKKRIYFTTPYLIPPEELINDLKFAALSGVDVRIIIPDVPDKKTVYLSTEGHLEELLAVGIKVYKLSGYFIHSKVFVFDDETTMYGTVNFDMRSFYLNFEENIIQYNDKKLNQEAADIIEKLLSDSVEVEYNIWRKRSIFKRFCERVVRILEPLF